MRTRDSFLNFIYNTLLTICNSVLGLIVRKTFLMQLGADVLGINSVYTNVVSFLALSELGIGEVIGMFLYKPLAQNDTPRIVSYMAALKKIYIIIGVSIIATGAIITPFVPHLMTTNYSARFIYISFLIYVLTSAVSYFFSYNLILLSADQKRYLGQKISAIVRVCVNLIYICVLLLTSNYFVFLFVGLFGNVIEYVLISMMVQKRYSHYLKNMHPNKLSVDEKKALFDKVRGMLSYRIGGYLVNSTDNIIISKFVGTVAVAYYANYYLIISIMDALCSGFSSSVVSSFGNLIHTEMNRFNDVFEEIQLSQFIIFGTTTPLIMCLSSDFVSVFFGDASIMSYSVVCFLCVVYYLNGYSNSLNVIRSVVGLYEKDKFINLLLPVINIIVSIWGVKRYGVEGVLIGTIVCYSTQKLIVLPLYIKKEIASFNILHYYRLFAKHFVETGICAVVLASVLRLFIVKNMLWWILKGFFATLFAILFMILFNCRNPHFFNLLNRLRAIRKWRSVDNNRGDDG